MRRPLTDDELVALHFGPSGAWLDTADASAVWAFDLLGGTVSLAAASEG